MVSWPTASTSRQSGVSPSMLPAAAQGALAVQCRADDAQTMQRCRDLVHAPSAAAAHAEQRVVAELGGDCRSPMAALVEVDDDAASLRVRVLSADGGSCLEADVAGSAARLDDLVTEAVSSLQRQGVAALMSSDSP